MERIGCLAALPSFLADSNLADGAFAPKSYVVETSNRERWRRYLASHRYDVEPGRRVHNVPGAALRVVLDVALALVGRGIWTLPSWRVEQLLAQRAREDLGWQVLAAPHPESGDLRLRLGNQIDPQERRHVFLPAPLDSEVDRTAVLARLCELADEASPGERVFIMEVASTLPAPLLCMLCPQREVSSMGLDPQVFADQRVDFALETPQGLRLVIEIDGGQHQQVAAQAHLDRTRDAALLEFGWKTWRIPTRGLQDIGRVRREFNRLLEENEYRAPEGGRNSATTSLFWSATAIARIQAMTLEATLSGFVPLDRPIKVAVIEHGTETADLAIEDLNDVLGRLGRLYGVQTPTLQLHNADGFDLLVDIDTLNPLSPPPRSDAAVAWSRPAAMAAEPMARRIELRSGAPRFLPAPPEEEILDAFIQDLFRKDGFRRTQDGHSDQAAITARILQGQDVVGLLPTGAGKSLPYMLAGLLLPGMTLYVGPLISLLQDQAERLREAGIGYVEYISSAQLQEVRIEALRRVQSEGTRFLLVSPERFLTASFLDALSNRALWRGDISQVVVDECHCVSEWGHEFRPAYLSLSRVARERSQRFGMQAPLVALTGTASTVVLADVLRELDIRDSSACIRAENLDRPELAMRCTVVNVPAKREEQIENSVRAFLRDYEDSNDGLLVFCPMRAQRSIGVFSIAAYLSRKIPGLDVRFFCGGDAPWEEYAVYHQRRRAAALTSKEVEQATPSWARSESGLRPWADVKAAVQRDFISGTKSSFRVLVATKAFGMGIDKPSVRKIVHAVSPTSPEAFYQEIGRAGRDRQSSEAELLFCDIQPHVTNRILDPGLTHDEVMTSYQEAVAEDRYGGGDFLRTFYFHQNAFQGMEPAVAVTFKVVQLIHNAIAKAGAPIVPFMLQDGPKRFEEKDVEYGIVRLIHLGVIDGYLKDYGRRVFNVEPNSKWLQIRTARAKLSAYIADHFASFMRRYHLVGGATQVEAIRSTTDSLSALYETAARQMMAFVYRQIERQRRAATRAMLEIARIGLVSGVQMRARLLHYLQASARFTTLLELLDPGADPSEWIEILVNEDHALSPQDLAELHGAAQRVLASFPTHPGLLFLSAVSRPIQTFDDPARSAEEFGACVRRAPEHSLDLSRVLWAFQWFRDAALLQKHELEVPVARVMGLLHVKLGSSASELVPFLHIDDVREHFLASLVRKATEAGALT